MEEEAEDFSHLPPCVKKLIEACEHLYEAAFLIPFPDLDLKPGTVEEISQVVQSAREWANRVQLCYGSQSGGEDSSSLWACFLSRERAISSWNGTTLPIPQLPGLWHVADVLGEIPSQFRDCGAGIFLNWFIDRMWVVRLEPSSEKRLIAFTIDNWDEIRRTLQIAHSGVLAKVGGLLSWVHERIETLKEASLPTVEKVRDLPGSKVEVEISCAGAKREAQITGDEAAFLEALGKDGKAVWSRHTKKSLLKNVPELAPWIQTYRSRHGKSADDKAAYRVPSALKPRLKLGAGS